MPGGPKAIPETERFYKWFTIKDSGCWEWHGTLSKQGSYGTITISRQRKGIKAHRLSYKMFKGEIPEGMCVCHKCDNTKCVNPDHLFLGTYADNNKDRHAKGRTKIMRGSRHGCSKLTEKDVLYIRKHYKRGLSKKLANKFGVCKENITAIARRRIWKHI